MESPRSPKRRRILASINPPEPRLQDDVPAKSKKRDHTMSPEHGAVREGERRDSRSRSRDRDPTAPRPTKFRFKSESSRSSRRREEERDDDRHRRRHRPQSRTRSQSRDRDGARDRDSDSHNRNNHRDRDPSRERSRRHRRRERDGEHDNDDAHRGSDHRRRRRRRRRHRAKSPSPSPGPAPDPFQDPPLSPTTAFRESLFDAMADDEGAAYWESVYGQPIHIYDPPGGGELERMTDDEYAAYVRQKMWEKTHAGLLEARARREREREEARRRAEEEARVAREMERSLRRGEERRRRKGLRERWERYRARWAAWEEAKGGAEGIPWPEGVGEVRGAEVDREAVRAFFVNGIGLEELGEKEFAARLKEERVRWHPDKTQQRLGGTVDEAVMRDVTAIFQVVDALWNDTRKSGV